MSLKNSQIVMSFFEKVLSFYLTGSIGKSVTYIYLVSRYDSYANLI